MLLCALVRHPLPEDVADNVAHSPSSSAWKTAWSTWPREFAAGSLALAAYDFTRNGYEGTWHEEESATALHSRRVLHEAWELSVDDPELAARWAALETLPGDTIGRKVWEMYQARGFTFPGTPGSAPPFWHSTIGCTCWRTTARPWNRRSRCSA